MADLTTNRPGPARRDRTGRFAAGGDRLAEVRVALRLAATAEDVMSVLVLGAESAFGAASAVAYAVGVAALDLVAAMGRAEDADEWLRSVPLDAEIPVALAMREGGPRWFESRAALAATFPGWAARVPHAERFGALAALPLRIGERRFGAFGLAFDRERTFSPEARALLVVLAAEGAVALERVRLLAAGGGAQAGRAASEP